MGALQVEPMDLETFLAWERDQELKYELVHGFARMMSGGTRAHGLIAANVVAALRPRLRGGPCLRNGPDFKILIPNGNLRYPDASVTCSRPVDLEALYAEDPSVVVEVLSVSTGWYDRTHKLRDYQSVPSLRHILLVSQDEALVNHWSRQSSGPWTATRLVGLDAVVDLPAVGAALPMAEIYEDVLAA